MKGDDWSGKARPFKYDDQTNRIKQKRGLARTGLVWNRLVGRGKNGIGMDWQGLLNENIVAK